MEIYIPTSRPTQWRWIIVMMFLLSAILGSHGQYQIQPLRENAGPFYEKLESIRLTQNYWRIVIFLDVGNLSQQIHQPNLLQDITQVYNNCLQKTAMKEDCRYAVQLDTLTNKLNKIQTKSERLNAILEEIQYYKPDIKTQPRTMQKRRVPMLGFIGSILGPVVGLLTSEDGEEYTNAINKLNDRQGNLSRIMKQQTHIIGAELHNIHEELHLRNTEIQELQTILTETIKNIHKQENVWNYEIYYRYLRQWSAKVEAKYDHLFETLMQITDIILNAREKKVHPMLINNNQLQEIINEIHTETENYEFPIPSSHIKAEDLHQIGKADIGYNSKRLLISIDIPLLERTIYQLYKIHPYPIFQNHVGNITGTAYILPKESYIALSYNDQKFLLVNQEYHNSCIKTIFHTICDANQPIYSTSISQLCEIQMLIKPSTETFRKCDVRIILNEETFWTQILSLQAWLYSTSKPELLSISCPNQKPVRKIINNSGLLRLGNGCTAMTTSITLTGIAVYKTKEE